MRSDLSHKGRGDFPNLDFSYLISMSCRADKLDNYARLHIGSKIRTLCLLNAGHGLEHEDGSAVRLHHAAFDPCPRRRGDRVAEATASQMKYSRSPTPSVAEPRRPLLLAVRSFVRSARDCPGVLRIALLGSLTTTKLIPKDADVLVTVDGAVELVELRGSGGGSRGLLKPLTLVPTFFLPTKTGATSVASAIIAGAFHAWHVSRKIVVVASTSATIFKSSPSRRS